MVEGWLTEEAIEFCTYYLDIKRVRVLESRHEERLYGNIDEHRQSLQTLYPSRL